MSKLTTVGMKWQLRIGAVFVLLAGLQLFFGTEHTDTYFAWTIKPPLLSAAFLGASYLTSSYLGFAASREAVWARARLAVPGPLTFTVLTLLATLLHLDRFHLHSPALTTALIAWVWLAVYAGVPISMTIVLLRQLRAPGEDPPRQTPLPPGLRVTSLILAVVSLLAGVVLFIAPQAVAPWWAWQLTPLTARAIASWLIALGIVAAQVARENDYLGAEPVMIFFALFGLLQALGLARYPDDLVWSEPRGWLYLVFLAAVLLLGISGWVAVLQCKSIALAKGIKHPPTR
ncbi:MAG: hypothetical protein HY872_16265 [Chloroflexi bacterium]|nr:hypothetical protein [Chloroflexota bacterium]